MSSKESKWDSLIRRKPSIVNLMQNEKGVDILEWYFRCLKAEGGEMQKKLNGVQAWIDYVNTWADMEHGVPGLVWELEESMKAGKLVKEFE